MSVRVSHLETEEVRPGVFECTAFYFDSSRSTKARMTKRICSMQDLCEYVGALHAQLDPEEAETARKIDAAESRREP